MEHDPFQSGKIPSQWEPLYLVRSSSKGLKVLETELKLSGVHILSCLWNCHVVRNKNHICSTPSQSIATAFVVTVGPGCSSSIPILSASLRLTQQMYSEEPYNRVGDEALKQRRVADNLFTCFLFPGVSFWWSGISATRSWDRHGNKSTYNTLRDPRAVDDW